MNLLSQYFYFESLLLIFVACSPFDTTKKHKQLIFANKQFSMSL